MINIKFFVTVWLGGVRPCRVRGEYVCIIAAYTPDYVDMLDLDPKIQTKSGDYKLNDRK